MVNLDDKNAIYEWDAKESRQFLKLFIYILRNLFSNLSAVVYNTLNSVVRGYLFKLLRDKKTIERDFYSNPNLLLFFPPFDAHYGDVINLLYFSNVIFQTKGKTLTIVSSDYKLGKICLMFEHASFIYYPTLKNKSIYWLMGPLYALIFRRVKVGRVNFINHPIFPFFEELIGITTLSMFEKKLRVKLTMDNITLPVTDFDVGKKIYDKLAQLGFIRGKTVLINIESRAINMKLSLIFWKKTILNLTEAGFGVILNNKIMELEGPNVKYLHMEWNELIPATKYCGQIISIRNGICDLLQFIDVRMIIIYPLLDMNGSVQNKFYFKFSQLYLKELIPNPPNIIELAYAPDFEDELSSRIANLIVF